MRRKKVSPHRRRFRAHRTSALWRRKIKVRWLRAQRGRVGNYLRKFKAGLRRLLESGDTNNAGSKNERTD